MTLTDILPRLVPQSPPHRPASGVLYLALAIPISSRTAESAVTYCVRRSRGIQGSPTSGESPHHFTWQYISYAMKFCRYTPAYTLRGFFKQLLSIFSSKAVYNSFNMSSVRHRHDLGHAIITHYVNEAEMLFPFRQPGSLSSRSAPYPYTESESHLEKLWNEDKSEEVVMLTYQSEDGNDVKQCTKKGMMRDPPGPQESERQEAPPQVQTPSLRASTRVKRIFKFECLNPQWQRARDRVAAYVCDECQLGPSNVPRWPIVDAPKPDSTSVVPYMIPAGSNQLARLRMDLLQVLCEHMPDESLHALAAAYSPVRDFLQRTNFIRKRQVRCFYLASHFEETPGADSIPEPAMVMGMGVALDRRTNRLSCDSIVDGFLSEAAYNSCGVRRSARKTDFTFFLPAVLNFEHFVQIKPRIFDALKTLSAEVSLTDPRRRANISRYGPDAASTDPRPARGTTPHVMTRSAAQADLDSVNVIFKFMRDLTVDYMHTADDIINRDPVAVRGNGGSNNSSQGDHPDDLYAISLTYAAEAFLAPYWQLMHLLISLCRDNNAILKAAYDRLRRFIDNPDKRTKEFEPDLGELVVVAALIFACQDEGLLPLREPEEPAPARRPRPRARSAQPSQPIPVPAAATPTPTASTHRYDLRHPHPAVPPAPPPRLEEPARPLPDDSLVRWSEHFIGPLLQEAMTRSAVEVVMANHDLQHFETGESPYRTVKSYQASRQTYRLVALQASMLAVFSYYETSPRATGHSPFPHPAQTHLDRQFGKPPTQAAHTLCEETKACFRLATWEDLFIKVQYINGRRWSEAETASALRQCMILSEQRGYHVNNYRYGDARQRLVALREKRERDWRRDHDRRMRFQERAYVRDPRDPRDPRDHRDHRR